MLDRDKLIEAIMPHTGFAGDVMARSAAEAIIAAHDAWLEAQGLVVVPREPTEAMIRAGDDESRYFPPEDTADIYRAMLAAAPLPAAPNEGEG